MMASKARSTQSIPKNATMGLSELNRIKALAAETKTMSTIEEDRQKLKQISENRTKNWPNTINALRTKKEHDKFEKFEREEVGGV